jgi:nicotinate-nucleotide adenylyltransferase
MIASYIKQFGGVDQVWLTLSPLNPLKSKPEELISDVTRLEMLKMATEGAEGIQTCDIELSMPRPNYTINTLDLLSKRYPGKKFKLIIGSDNWRIFNQWRDYQRIIDDYGVIIYPRPGYPVDMATIRDVDVEVINSPSIDLSSTFIRRAIARGRDMTYFLPTGIGKYIKQHKLYQ